MPQNITERLRVRVIDIVSEQFGVPREDITPEATLDDLDLDSLALVELSILLQEEFAIPPIEEELSMDDTFARFLEKLAAKAAAA
ncbi:phosphopantetheine-binding protein [Spirillospora sp. NPDC050679]